MRPSTACEDHVKPNKYMAQHLIDSYAPRRMRTTQGLFYLNNLLIDRFVILVVYQLPKRLSYLANHQYDSANDPNPVFVHR